MKNNVGKEKEKIENLHLIYVSKTLFCALEFLICQIYNNKRSKRIMQTTGLGKPFYDNFYQKFKLNQFFKKVIFFSSRINSIMLLNN